MPLYDYRCATCGALFEHLQTPGEPDPAASPCCQAPVTRALSVPADFRGRFQAPRCSSCMEGDTPRDLPPCLGAGGCCAGDEDESPT